MPGELRRRFVVTKRYLELSAPVEGELRREPIEDADVPCPRCGGREWLLIERRAERERPFTRWRALACASCGGADGWQSAGRTRPGRAAERWPEWDDERPAALPEHPTIADVASRASFRVFLPPRRSALRGISSREGTITGVTVESGKLEVISEIRHQKLHDLPHEVPAAMRARTRLQGLLDDYRAAYRSGRSEPAQALQRAASARQAAAEADAAAVGEAVIEVDGAPVAFALVERGGRWVAVADAGDESITVTGRDTPFSAIALRRVQSA